MAADNFGDFERWVGLIGLYKERLSGCQFRVRAEGYGMSVDSFYV